MVCVLAMDSNGSPMVNVAQALARPVARVYPAAVPWPVTTTPGLRSVGPTKGTTIESAALSAQDVEPCSNETADRIATGIVTVVPFLMLGVVVWQAWQSLLHWHDFVVFGVLYVLTGFGITIGFHRHFTHRAFATSRPVRAVLAVLGTAAIEGPITAWVADHRKHHAFSDQEGDPHSPHVDHGHGVRGALRGLAHAHVGWLFLHTQRANKQRYAPDLVADPLIRFIDRTTLWWIALGLAAPFGLGYLLGGTLAAGLTGLLWGGACGSCCCTTSRTRSTRCVTSSAAAASRPATTRATSPGWRR